MKAVKPPVRGLQVAHPEEMLDPVGVALAQPVHHRHRRLHPLAMGFLLHAEPLLGLRLLLGHAFAHRVHEDLATAARDRVEPGLAQLPHHLGDRQPESLGEEHHFGWREAVDVNRDDAA